MTSPDTQPRLTAAQLTPNGRGALAMLRIRGDAEPVGAALQSLFVAADGRDVVDHAPGRVVFGRWGTDACRRRRPYSN